VRNLNLIKVLMVAAALASFVAKIKPVYGGLGFYDGS
jgi:hypothetical protein